MSTNRLQEHLAKLNAIEKDVQSIHLAFIQKDKIDFLSRIHKLKKDLIENKSHVEILVDLNVLEELAKKLVENQIHDHLNTIEQLKCQLKELKEQAKVFKREENKSTSSKIKPSAFFGNDDSEEKPSVDLNKRTTYGKN